MAREGESAACRLGFQPVREGSRAVATVAFYAFEWHIVRISQE